MATYIITINLDNAAFQHDNEGAAVADILEFIGARCADNGEALNIPIFDSNGNNVGDAKRK